MNILQKYCAGILGLALILALATPVLAQTIDNSTKSTDTTDTTATESQTTTLSPDQEMTATNDETVSDTDIPKANLINPPTSGDADITDDTAVTEENTELAQNTNPQALLLNAPSTPSERAEALVQTQRLKERGVLSSAQDSDGDGISDYDERNLYGTDPFDATTVDGELTDGEKLLKGIDPTSAEAEEIVYEDPREVQAEIIADVYTVRSLETTETVTGDDGKLDAKKIQFTGTALPNSYVTIYIFSTPIVVTVRSDANGEWTYELDQELEDGNHEVYVASVNNTGKILAKSRSIPFVKEAAAAELISPDVAVASGTTDNLFTTDMLILMALVLIGAIVAVLLIIGLVTNKGVNNQTPQADV